MRSTFPTRMELKPFSNLVVDHALFVCPRETCHGDLTPAPGGAALVCSMCGAAAPVRDGIVEFVAEDLLDIHKRNELHGNELTLDESTIEHYVDKENWSDFYSHFSAKKIRMLADLLQRDQIDEVAFLGVGTAYEVGRLWRAGFRPARMLLSDLNRSTLEIAAYNLTAQGVSDDTEVCLFTSDLDAVPVRRRDLPLVVYECLHHTPDMHATVNRLMYAGYERIYFVEPTTNWAMRTLAKRGVARRVEYSGVDPDRLNIQHLRDMCEKFGYDASIETLWEFPEDYFRRISPSGSPRMTRVITASIDALSAIGRPFRFGNFTVCRLTRRMPRIP